jgi:hypothetical protein
MIEHFFGPSDDLSLIDSTGVGTSANAAR